MKKGMLAPIIVTALLVIYYAIYFIALVSILEGWLKYLLLILPVLIAGVAIYVCVERIKEIRSGEEDDLGKY